VREGRLKKNNPAKREVRGTVGNNGVKEDALYSQKKKSGEPGHSTGKEKVKKKGKHRGCRVLERGLKPAEEI